MVNGIKGARGQQGAALFAAGRDRSKVSGRVTIGTGGPGFKGLDRSKDSCCRGQENPLMANEQQRRKIEAGKDPARIINNIGWDNLSESIRYVKRDDNEVQIPGELPVPPPPDFIVDPDVAPWLPRPKPIFRNPPGFSKGGGNNPFAPPKMAVEPERIPISLASTDQGERVRLPPEQSQLPPAIRDLLGQAAARDASPDDEAGPAGAGVPAPPRFEDGIEGFDSRFIGPADVRGPRFLGPPSQVKVDVADTPEFDGGPEIEEAGTPGEVRELDVCITVECHSGNPLKDREARERRERTSEGVDEA